jgi:succinate dehydrogenase / fumarate reductase cytochrome b subunit
MYAIGVLSTVFHLANGLWTMGITWGVWTSAAAQRRANYVCVAFGILLAAAGLGALGGFSDVDREKAIEVEKGMEQGRRMLKGEEIEEHGVSPTIGASSDSNDQ